MVIINRQKRVDNSSVRRKYVMLLCLILCQIMFTGCAKSDKKVLSDVKAQFVSDYSGAQFEEIELDMVQRQTNANEKKDYASVSLIAENADVCFSCNYEVMYVKYNDGWKLEKCDMTGGQYTIKRTTVTEKDAERVVLSNYQGMYEQISFKDRKTNLNDGSDVFVYYGSYSDGYLTQTDEISVEYKYSLYDGWVYNNHIKEENNKSWNILGKWSYQLGDSNMWIRINKITNEQIEFEYDFNYIGVWSNLSGWHREAKHYASNGVETRNLDKTENGIAFNLLDDDMATPYVYVTNHGGVTFDGVWFNQDDTYVFYYEDGDGYATRNENGVWPQIYKIEDMPIIDYTKEKPVSGGTKTSSKTYNLYGQYKTLDAEVSLSEHAGSGSLGEISIIGDGKVLYSVKANKYNENYNKEQISVDVSGVKSLTIIRNVAYVKYEFGNILKMTNEEPTITINNIQVSR